MEGKAITTTTFSSPPMANLIDGHIRVKMRERERKKNKRKKEEGVSPFCRK